jgi:Ca-activated chloride channel family protein
MTFRSLFSSVCRRFFLWPAQAGIAVLASGAPAAVQAAECDIGLVLALDVSGSVSAVDFKLQTDGIADAFEDPELIQVLSFYDGGVMVAATQWSGDHFQELFVNWTVIKSPDDARFLAGQFRTMTRGAADLTATGSALKFANALFGQAPADCGRRVIDVSTDGLSNRGPDLSRTADAVAATGTVINALVIYGDSPSLIRYFDAALVRGAGSFSHAIETYSDYPEAIKRKLLRELRPDVSINAPPGAGLRAN